MQNFIDYVLSFYGEGGIYDFGATAEEVILATNARIKKHGDIPYSGDSFDRELVRDIILENRGEEPWGLI